MQIRNCHLSFLAVIYVCHSLRAWPWAYTFGWKFQFIDCRCKCCWNQLCDCIHFGDCKILIFHFYFKFKDVSTCYCIQVVSPFPPSDKIGINSVQREFEEIIPMKQMKMDWIPYIPLEDRYSSQFGYSERFF